MKNYALNSSEAERFITDVRENSNGTLTITFADGKVFKNIAYTPDNIQKIIAQQEEQAAKGISNYKVFKKKESRAEGRLLLTGIGLCGATYGVFCIPAVEQAIQQTNGWPVTLGVGLVLVLGVIPGYARIVRENKRVRELEKLKYRQEHLEDLRSYQQYPNSLSGVNPRVANWIQSEGDPFGILNIDQYDEEDLKQICGNIETEKEFGFQYKKGKPRH